jgi:hypothetical protein
MHLSFRGPLMNLMMAPRFRALCHLFESTSYFEKMAGETRFCRLPDHRATARWVSLGSEFLMVVKGSFAAERSQMDLGNADNNTLPETLNPCC